MSIAKLISLSLLAITSQVIADTETETDYCKSIFVKEGRSINYFSCLQDRLSEAQIKAKIREAETPKNAENPWDNIPKGAPMPTPADTLLEAEVHKASSETVTSELPLYVAYSASKESKEAVIAYGNAEVRVTRGSVLSDQWKVVDFNEYSMELARKNVKKTIPLTIVATGNK